MSIHINRLEHVHAIGTEVDKVTRPDCPICPTSLGKELCEQHHQQHKGSVSDYGMNRLELLKHISCRTTFHASCIQRWLEQNSSCPMCRRCPILQDRDGEPEGLSDMERRLHRNMTEMIRQRLALSDQWTLYWERRLTRHNELGTTLFNQQPGYILHNEFRNTILQARLQQTQFLNHAIQTVRQARIAANTIAEDSNVDEPRPFLVPYAQQSFRPASSDTIDVERRHLAAESIAQWNLFAARNTSDERASEEFEAAWTQSTARFQAAVGQARAVLENQRELDTRRDLWEDDPPNPL